MNINEMYPSEYIKAADLKGRDWPLTISHVTTEKLGDDTKPVLYFQQGRKGLALNKTNSMTIASYYGPETDGWIGKQVILYPTKVPYQGTLTEAVRVRVADASYAPAQQAAPQPTFHTQPVDQHPNAPGGGADLDDEIPF